MLEYLFVDPESGIHIRGFLSGRLGVSYAGIRSALEKLENSGLLEKEELSKMALYSAGGEYFRRLKKN
jgi:Mn-dependent DtxR family transcriptional regulator